MRRITKNDGTPFPTKLSTSGAIGKLVKSEGLKKEDCLIAEVEGGFVIAAPDLIIEETSQEPEVAQADAPDLAVVETKVDQSGEEPAKVKHKATTPWTPSRKLDIPEHLKDPRFDYKLANSDKKGRIRQLINDGFEVDHEISKKMSADMKRFDKNLDTTLTINELVVMRILKEKAAEIRKYYSDMANGAVSQDEDETADQMRNEAGVTMYKPQEANMNKR